jgi:hypothetical protein
VATSGARHAILAMMLVAVGFLPATREIVAALRGRASCDCAAASASCPLRGLGGACAATCRHGGGRPDGWNADCGCRHPGPQGSVAGRELPALPVAPVVVRSAPALALVEEPQTLRPAGRSSPPESPPPRGGSSRA